ncbi:hypothetical protein J5N97_004514 [Dioscorea zingiberensis]|uniref:GDSL esterase/lipase n=1 Tax=Dioscorea zingiberensis TaxID=325984 RepID=A0A9D5D6S9_9LILI|nr:hypothetical protein J5N97_004514 [Dioscorea zingiberensis]
MITSVVSSNSFVMSQLSILFTSFIILLNSFRPAAGGCFTSIFSFGDSFTDTGNLKASGTSNPIINFPYGETYFHHPTGRCSDGRLIVDFIAEAACLPLLPPYLLGPDEHRDFRKGVNFAVVGATALEISFFVDKGISLPVTNYSLGSQLEWFKLLLPSLCSSDSECKNVLGNALFLMGEIGGNDYFNVLGDGRSLEETKTFVPLVVNAISSAITSEFFGARTLLVPGNFPNGCISAYLSIFHVSNTEDYYEETGCIKWLNEFTEYYNQLLIKELNHLQKMYPHATIIYADYYQTLMTIYQSPGKYGFQSSPLGACYGSGGLYNYNSSCLCGDLGSTVCMEPSSSDHSGGASSLPDCNGIALSYILYSRELIRLHVSDPKAQPYAFRAAATILNSGDRDLKSWAYLISFQHRELIVSASPTVISDSSPFPYTIPQDFPHILLWLPQHRSQDPDRDCQ